MPLKRHRHTRFGHTYNSQIKDMKNFHDLALPFAPDKPFEGRIRITANYYFKRPKSHYRSGKYKHLLKANAPTHHIQTPDFDNLLKYVGDSLGLSKKFYNDDRQIDIVAGGKHWARWDFVSIKMDDCLCDHKNKEFQPAEYENNVPESLTCEDCGEDLTMHEPDWDSWSKDARF